MRTVFKLIPLLYGSKGFVVNQDKMFRDKWASLMQEIDTKNDMGKLEHYITADDVVAFLETEHQVTSKRRRREAPRRRHTTCECPDTPGDATTTNCLDRRFGVIFNAYEEVTKHSDAAGFTADSGRNVLRQTFNDLQKSVNTRNAETKAAERNISDSTTGYVAETDRMLQRILNEETLMVHSVNSAWMSLINATTQTVASANTVQGLMTNATQDMLNWFSRMQATQDDASFQNMQKTVNYAKGDLGFYVNAINQAQGTVWKILSTLDKHMAGSETSASALGDSLVTAADNLANKISTFNSSIPSIIQPTVDQGRSELSQTLNALQTYFNGQVSALGTSAMGKQKSTRDASSGLISNQLTSAQNLLTSAQGQASKSLDGVQSYQDSFVNTSKTVFANAARYVESQVQNKTNEINTRVGFGRSNLTGLTTGTSQINNVLSTYTNDEKSAVTKVSTEISNAQAGANKALADGIAAIDTKSSQTLTGAASLSTGAVTAVGSNFQTNMDQMGLNSNQLMSTLSSNANDAAKQASSAQSALAVSASQGSSAITAASDTVSSQLQNALKNILNSVGNIPGGIPATSMSSGTMLSVIQAAKTNMSAASEMVKQLFFGTQAGTMQNQTQAQDAIGNFLMVLKNAAPDADNLVNSIGSTIQKSAGDGTSTVSSATAQNQQNSQATANAANQISVAQNSFANILSSIVSQLSTSGQNAAGGPLQGGLALTLAGGSTAIKDMENQLASSIDQQLAQGQRNDDAINAAKNSVATASSSANAQLGAAAAEVSDTVSGALGDIDTFLASSQNSASSEVHGQLDKINTLKAQAAIQVGQIDTQQMEQIRAVAASAESLMNEINSFLKDNSLPLYSDIQGLGTAAQKLFMFMDTLQKQHDRIGADADDEGPYSWDDVLRSMLSALRADNASSVDALSKISGTFNSSASAVSANVSSFLSALTAQYANTAGSIQTQLASASNSALQNLSSVSSTSAIDQIKGIQQEVTGLASNATEILTNATSYLSVISGSQMQEAFAGVSAANEAAAKDAAFSASILAQVQGNATLQATNAQLGLQEEALPEGEVQRAGSLSMLNANMAKSQLAQQKMAIDKLLADSASISTDYAAEVAAQEQARQGKSSLVFDRVVAAKGEAAAMMGSITQRMVQNREARAANVTSGTADQQVRIGLLRRAMNSLVDVFDKFISTVQGSFKTSAGDRDGFAVAVLGALRQKMTQLDNEIYKENQDLVQDLVDVSGVFDAYQTDPIDNDLKVFGDRVKAWTTAEVEAIAEQDNAIPLVVNETTLAVPSTLNNTINSAVLSVAKTAEDILVKNGKPVPAELTAILSEYTGSVAA